MKGFHRGWFVCAVAFALPAQAGGLKKACFAETKPGAWTTCVLTSSDGSKSSFRYQRQLDDAGRLVIDNQVKILAVPKGEQEFQGGSPFSSLKGQRRPGRQPPHPRRRKRRALHRRPARHARHHRGQVFAFRL